jgi:hypothetical protein
MNHKCHLSGAEQIAGVGEGMSGDTLAGYIQGFGGHMARYERLFPLACPTI